MGSKRASWYASVSDHMMGFAVIGFVSVPKQEGTLSMQLVEVMASVFRIVLFPHPACPRSQIILLSASGCMREVKMSCRMSSRVPGRHRSRSVASMFAGFRSLNFSIGTVIDKSSSVLRHTWIEKTSHQARSTSRTDSNRVGGFFPSSSSALSCPNAFERRNSIFCVSPIVCGSGRCYLVGHEQIGGG